MKKFEQNPSCEKCGYYVTTLHYSCKTLPEHLTVSCDMCGYYWRMETRDQGLLREIRGEQDEIPQ